MKAKPRLRYCGPCDQWLPTKHKECPECGADTDLAAPEDAPEDERDPAYEKAERSDAWERRGGGGL